jgi:DNA repair protein SbcC/Rad50
MIPIHLRLSGFLSYLEPVDLDFSSFDLACISGSNGAGKSSLLDAITWSLFGQARRRDDTVINSHAKAAEVIFDFRYEKNMYRVARSKPRDRSTVLEFLVCDPEGNWRPLTEKSMRETEARIQSTLRLDYDTFINASFFLQGKADLFAQQRPGDRKRVLSNILGLEIWETYRENAVERRKIVESQMKALDGQLAEIDGELNQEADRRKKLEDAEADLKRVQDLCKAQETALVSLQRLAASLDEQKRLVDVLARGLNETKLRLNRMNTQRTTLITEQEVYQDAISHEAEVTAAYQRMKELRESILRWDAVAKNFREIEARRADPLRVIAREESRLEQEHKGLYEQEMLILSEEARLPDLKAQVKTLAGQMEKLEEYLMGRRSLEEELQSVQQNVADARSENHRLKEAMTALKERIRRLDEVEGANCPLCGQPLSANERAALMESLRVEGKEMGDRYRANQELLGQSEARIKQTQAQIAGLARYEEELRTAARQHTRSESDLVRVELNIENWRAGGKERGAGRLVELGRILSECDYAQEARAQLAAIDEEARVLGYDAAAHDAVRRAELESRSAEEAMSALEKARASLAPLERQVAALEEQIATETAGVAEQDDLYRAALDKYENEARQLPDINQAEKDVFDLQARSNKLRMEVGMVRQSVAVLAVQRERKSKLQVQRDSLSTQAARYKALERAFSKDGVPALLIEQALPEIESQANEILDRLSAGSMSVHFETQKQYKDKSRDDRRETLDILISDSTGVREYELFSGGEAFRVNFAIRLALSRVLAQRAGARLQTLVIDEGFGSQDSQGRQRLIESINQVRHEFAKILVITHMEELKEAFPARIEVEKGLNGSHVRVVL